MMVRPSKFEYNKWKDEMVGAFNVIFSLQICMLLLEISPQWSLVFDVLQATINEYYLP